MSWNKKSVIRVFSLVLFSLIAVWASLFIVSSVRENQARTARLAEAVLRKLHVAKATPVYHQPIIRKKFALFVRAVPGFSESRLNRVKKWTADVNMNFANQSVDVWIAVDVTTPEHQLHRVVNEFISAGLPYQIFTVCRSQILDAFPAASDYVVSGDTMLSLPLSLSLWRTRMDGEGREYERVWVVEDTADYCGSISSFFQEYADTEGDFFSTELKVSTSRSSSEIFNAWLGTKRPATTTEPVQGFSWSFLTKIAELSRGGLHCEGTEFTPSVCLKLGTFWCRSSKILDHNIGWKFAKEGGVMMDPRNFANVCYSNGHNKWFHPLK